MEKTEYKSKLAATKGARRKSKPAGTHIRRAASIEVGSGNVFRDLGRPDADERQLKVQLAMRVNALLAAAALTQAQVTKALGIAQPHVSDLVRYRLNRFSVERLIHFVTLLDRDVEIVIRPRAPERKTANVAVLVAS
jgi:predicted XRE-type DNA-binding protein